MKANFAASLTHVLRHEGGYSNHPADPGGATNKGVIQRVYDPYRRKKGQTPRSVKFITEEEIADIYRSLYWDKISGDDLPKGIDYCVFDAAVNSGPSRGARWLQMAINKCAGSKRCTVDEVVGPATIDAADDYNPHEMIDAILDARLGFMKVARHSKTKALLFPTFGRGWTNRLFGYMPQGATVRRADGVDDVAKSMADSVPTQNKPALPRREIKTDELPGWLVALIAIGAAIFGAIQWMN
jgi:lysozyme family protein